MIHVTEVPPNIITETAVDKLLACGGSALSYTPMSGHRKPEQGLYII